VAVRIRNAGAALLALLMLLALFGPCGAALAEAAPSGSRVAPVTPKPWLAPVASTPTPSPAEMQATEAPLAVGAGASPTATPPPSSLNDWADDFTPTASPTQAALPGVLGLKDETALRVLLIGTDAYTLKEAGRSDTMILLQVDLRDGEIRMVSFLRDLYVQIPGHGKTRLNAAYVYGGAALLKDTLQSNFHVEADRTLAVNFSLMVDLIDQIGGVTVDVSERERKQLNSILKFYNTHNGYRAKDGLLNDAGAQCLTGKQALCYSRIRKMDSDFARAGRQRKVLEGIYERIRTMDALSLANLLTRMLPKVKTDFTLADAVALIPTLMQLNSIGFEELTVPVAKGYQSETIHGMMVLVPDLSANQDAISNFLR